MIPETFPGDVLASVTPESAPSEFTVEAPAKLDDVSSLSDAISPPSPAAEKVASKRAAPLTLRELMARPELLRPPVSLLPHGIAQAGRVTVFSAREKKGKSTWTAQAAAALSVGRDFLAESLERATVLWYAIDEPLGETVLRFQRFSADADRVLIQAERPTPDELRAEIAATGAKLVVIDTLTELWNGLIGSEKEAGDVAAFLRPYIDVARETGAAVIFLHHTTKSGGEYRGSVQIGASADIVLTMQSLHNGGLTDDTDSDESDDGRRRIHGKGRGGVSVDLRLAFDGDNYSLGDHPIPLRGRIKSLLAVAPASASSMAEKLGVRKERVLAETRIMLAEGEARHNGRTLELIPHAAQDPSACRKEQPVPEHGSGNDLEGDRGTAGASEVRP